MYKNFGYFRMGRMNLVTNIFTYRMSGTDTQKWINLQAKEKELKVTPLTKFGSKMFVIDGSTNLDMHIEIQRRASSPSS